MAEPDGLVEWLTAQIDEDEQSARDWRENYSPQHPSLVDPDRLEAEVAAKRAILARHRPREDPPWGIVCDGCGYEGPNDNPRYLISECPELRDLATVYADREGWREEWRS